MVDTKVKKTIEEKAKKPDVKAAVKKAVTTKTGRKISATKPGRSTVSLVKTMKNRSGIHKVNARKTEEKEAGKSVKVTVVGVDGTSKGSINLSPKVFGATPNKNLIAQAVRVYLANQRQGNASTKTRADVNGSTRKIYRQKGTGRARHGAAKGPIFVGGGIVFGPHPHDFSLKFPKKMKKAALINALSQKAQEGLIRVIDGDFSGKTKEVATLMKAMELNKKGKVNKVLFVTDKNANSARAAHNLGGLEIESAATLSTYGVVICRNVVFMKSAIEDVTTRLLKD